MTDFDEKRPAIADLVASALTLVLFVTNLRIEVNEPIWLTICGVSLLLLSLGFFVPPFFHLSRLGEPPDGQGFYATTKVVDSGLYSVVRHPQYLGYMLLLFGLALTDPHPLAVGVAFLASVFLYVQCFQEERFCVKQFGGIYEAYMKRVPRLNVLKGIVRRARRPTS